MSTVASENQLYVLLSKERHLKVATYCHKKPGSDLTQAGSPTSLSICSPRGDLGLEMRARPFVWVLCRDAGRWAEQAAQGTPHADG